MAVKDCFSKRWISYNFPMTCTAKYCVKPIKEIYAIRSMDFNLNNLVLRTNNGTQYIAKELKHTTRLLNNRHLGTMGI